jgi:hypothetical protein
MANLLLNTAFTQGSLIEQVSGKTFTHNLSTPLSKYNGVYGFDIGKLNLSESASNNRLEISGLIFPSIYTFSFSFNIGSQIITTTPMFNRDTFSTLNQSQQYLFASSMNLSMQLGTNVFPTVNIYGASNAMVVGLNICVLSFDFVAKTIQFNLNNIITNLAMNAASNNPNFSTFFRFGYNTLTANPSKDIVINSLRIFNSALTPAQISSEYQYHLGLKSVIKPTRFPFNPDKLKYNTANIIADYNFKNSVNGKLYDKSSLNGTTTLHDMIQKQDGLENINRINSYFSVDNIDARALCRSGNFSFHLIFKYGNFFNSQAQMPIMCFGSTAGGGVPGIGIVIGIGTIYIDLFSESRNQHYLIINGTASNTLKPNNLQILSVSILNSVMTCCINGISIAAFNYNQTNAYATMSSTAIFSNFGSSSGFLTSTEYKKFILKNKVMSTAEMQSFYDDNVHTVIKEDFSNYPVGQLSLPATMSAVNTKPIIIEFPTQISQSTNILKNTGTPETTDWVDTNSDGLADNMALSGFPVPSIVTGNGFVGNAQRITSTATGANGIYYLGTGLEQLKLHSYYKVSFKYRGNTTMAIYNVSPYYIGQLPINTGNAQYAEFYMLITDSMNIPEVITFYLQYGVAGNYFEIDEYRIFEVLNPIQSKKGLLIPTTASTNKIIVFNDPYIYGTKTFTMLEQACAWFNGGQAIYYFLSDGIPQSTNKPNNGIGISILGGLSENGVQISNTVNGVLTTLGSFNGANLYFCKLCVFKVVITPSTISLYENNILLLTVNTPTISFIQKSQVLWTVAGNEPMIGNINVTSI